MAKYYKDKNGEYRKRVPIIENGVPKRNDNGRIMYKFFYGKTQKELEQRVETYFEDIRNGVNPTSRNTLFKDLSHIWLNYNVDSSEGTRKQYEGLLNNYILDAIGNVRIKDIKVSDLQGLINNLYELGKGKSLLRKVKIVCVGCMNLAIDNKLISYNPFLSVKIPSKAKEGTREGLTIEQESAVLKYWKGHRMGLGALILLECGLRKGELVALQWSDIDFNNKMIRVSKSAEFLSDGNKPTIKGPKTKNGKRDVPVPEGLMSALREEKKKGLFVITSIDGNQMTKQAFKRGWDSYMHYLNRCCGGSDKINKYSPGVIALESFTPHQLRHTFATNLYYNSVPLKEAQYLLGHSDIKTTLNIYTHLDKQKMSSGVSEYLKSMDKKMSNVIDFETKVSAK